MMRLIFFFSLLSTLIIGAAQPVQDNTKIFSKTAISKANQLIQEIKKTHQVSVVLETVDKIPFSNLDEAITTPEKDFLFSAYNKAQTQKVGTDKISIVISEPQSLVLAWVGTKLHQEKLFTESDRNIMIKMVAMSFQNKNFDAGLIEGIELVKAAIQSNKNGKPLLNSMKKVKDAETKFEPFWRFVSYACIAFIIVSLLLGFLKPRFRKLPTAQEA